ncbi:MAG TPA: hypothetical protein VIM34_02600, partial [Burkholderiaceae bacterium]
MDESGAPLVPAPAPAPAPTPLRPPRRALRTLAGALLAGLALLVTLLAALTAAAWWSARTERGSAWLLSVLPGVQVEAPKGVLFGDFEAQRLVVRLPGGSTTLTLTGVGWRGLAITRAPAPLWLRVAIDSVAARRVDLATTTTASSTPRSPPANLRLPIELELRSLHIGELHARALGAQPVRDLDARVHLGTNAGAEH